MKLELVYKGIKIEISSEFRPGAAESIMFIHGLGCSKESFKDVWRIPEFRDYTILTFDLLGFGDSSKPREFSYTMEDHAAICKLVVERLNLEQVHLVGHSMGGAIGLLLIEKIPAKVLSFTNLEGNLIGDDCTFSREVVGYTWDEFEDGIFNEFGARIKDAKVLVSSSSRSNSVYYGWLAKSDPYAYYKSSESLVEWSDSRKLLQLFNDLAIKKWYVFGAVNKNAPVLKMLGDVPKIEIARAGHFMMIDNPEELYKKLLNALADERDD